MPSGTLGKAKHAFTPCFFFCCMCAQDKKACYRPDPHSPAGVTHRLLQNIFLCFWTRCVNTVKCQVDTEPYLPPFALSLTDVQGPHRLAARRTKSHPRHDLTWSSINFDNNNRGIKRFSPFAEAVSVKAPVLCRRLEQLNSVKRNSCRSFHFYSDR